MSKETDELADALFHRHAYRPVTKALVSQDELRQLASASAALGAVKALEDTKTDFRHRTGIDHSWLRALAATYTDQEQGAILADNEGDRDD